jgi:hypothetical protein
MLNTLRRYWIGLLVLVLIGLHATIVGVIRIQANQAKAIQSCEVDLGSFYILDAPRNQTIHLRVHVLVPVNHRLQSRQLIEQNRQQVRQSLEEFCRQADPLLLTDPMLSDLKGQMMDVMVQTVGETAAVDVVVTEFHPSSDTTSMAFSAPTRDVKERKRMVITRQARDEERRAAHEASASHGSDGHGGAHGEEAHGSGGHGGGH